MPLPLTISCSCKIQIGFTFRVPAYLGSPGKRAVKRVCVLFLAVSRLSRVAYGSFMALSPFFLFLFAFSFFFSSFLQCFDTVGWVSGRASGLYKLSDGVLVWSSVWSKVQIVCIWPFLNSIISWNPDWFYLSGTGLPRLSWKGGRYTGVVVVIVVVFCFCLLEIMVCWLWWLIIHEQFQL